MGLIFIDKHTLVLALYDCLYSIFCRSKKTFVGFVKLFLRPLLQLRSRVVENKGSK